MSRILFLCELYWPEEISTGYIVTRVAEHLASSGFGVRVLTAPASREYRPVDAPAHEVRNGVDILRCRGTRFPKDSLPLRAINLLSRTLTISARAVLGPRADTIVVLTNPPLLPFGALLAARLRRSKLVIWVHDVYPDVLEPAMGIRPNGLVMRALSIGTRFLLRSADTLIVLGRDVEDRLSSRYGVDRGRMVRIPTWADLETVHPQSKDENSLIIELGLSGRFVVLYTGNLGRTHGTDDLLCVAESRRDDPQFALLIIGYGAYHEAFREACRERRLENVFFAPFRSREYAGVAMNACDLAIISLKEGMEGVSVPSRVYNILAAGRPVIGVTTESSELGRIIREEEAGWVVPPGDREGLIRAVDEAVRDGDEVRRMGVHARRAAEAKYSFSTASERYDRLFRELEGIKPS